MVVTICGRQYPDLPFHLMTCPECNQAALAWDGRWTWKCGARRLRKDGSLGPTCTYGVSLAGLFDSPDLGLKVTMGRVQLRGAQLTHYALTLATSGTLRFDWLDDAEIARQWDNLDDDVREEDELAALRRVMVEPALPGAPE